MWTKKRRVYTLHKYRIIVYKSLFLDKKVEGRRRRTQFSVRGSRHRLIRGRPSIDQWKEERNRGIRSLKRLNTKVDPTPPVLGLSEFFLHRIRKIVHIYFSNLHLFEIQRRVVTQEYCR